MNPRNETFSAREYGQMLMCLGEARGNASLALRLYVQRHPNERHPANSRTITRAYQRALENLPIVPHQEGAGRTIRARSEQAILDVVRRNPCLGTRTAAKLVRRNNGPRVSHWAVHKVLRKDKQHPYRIHKDEDSLPGPAEPDEDREEKEIKVFCPKCNSEVSHTAEGIQLDQTKIIITKVYHYFEQEYEELKKTIEEIDQTPLSMFRQRTALATGVSETTVLEILEEEARRNEELRLDILRKQSLARKRPRQTDSSSEDGDSDENNDFDDEQPSAVEETETLVIKEEPVEPYHEEPEVYVELPNVKEEPDVSAENQELTDPISIDLKTEPRTEEATTSKATPAVKRASKSKVRKTQRNTDTSPATATPPTASASSATSVPRTTSAPPIREVHRAKPRSIGGHTKEGMKEALKQIRTGTSVRKAAKLSGIPISTLRRYNLKSKASQDLENLRLVPNYEVNKVFSEEQEEKLISRFKQCSSSFHGLTEKESRRVAYKMAEANHIKMPENWRKNQMAGKEWLRSFRRRHPELSLRKLERSRSTKTHNKKINKC